MRHQGDLSRSQIFLYKVDTNVFMISYLHTLDTRVDGGWGGVCHALQAPAPGMVLHCGPGAAPGLTGAGGGSGGDDFACVVLNLQNERHLLRCWLGRLLLPWTLGDGYRLDGHGWGLGGALLGVRVGAGLHCRGVAGVVVAVVPQEETIMTLDSESKGIVV